MKLTIGPPRTNWDRCEQETALFAMATMKTVSTKGQWKNGQRSNLDEVQRCCNLDEAECLVLVGGTTTGPDLDLSASLDAALADVEAVVAAVPGLDLLPVAAVDGVAVLLVVAVVPRPLLLLAAVDDAILDVTATVPDLGVLAVPVLAPRDVGDAPRLLEDNSSGIVVVGDVGGRVRARLEQELGAVRGTRKANAEVVAELGLDLAVEDLARLKRGLLLAWPIG